MQGNSIISSLSDAMEQDAACAAPKLTLRKYKADSRHLLCVSLTMRTGSVQHSNMLIGFRVRLTNISIKYALHVVLLACIAHVPFFSCACRNGMTFTRSSMPARAAALTSTLQYSGKACLTNSSSSLHQDCHPTTARVLQMIGQIQSMRKMTQQQKKSRSLAPATVVTIVTAALRRKDRVRRPATCFLMKAACATPAALLQQLLLARNTRHPLSCQWQCVRERQQQCPLLQMA
jgi:hypothetical protein